MNQDQMDYVEIFTKRLDEFIKEEKNRTLKVLTVEEINAIHAETFRMLGRKADYWKQLANIE